MAKWSTVGGVIAVTAGVASWASVVRADEPAATGQTSPAAVTTAAPDVVRMKNGGLLRGTISELVPGASVTIVTLTGEARTLAMADVTYAGPAVDAPASAGPSSNAAPAPGEATQTEGPRGYVTVEAGRAHLHLVSDPPGLVFERQDAKAFSRDHRAVGFARLCAAPCDITLPAGAETIAVGRDDERHYQVQLIHIPEGHSELRAYYEDNQGTRNIGWIILGAGIVGGGALMAVGVNQDDDSVRKPLVGAAWLTAAVGIGVGIGFILVRDDARFEHVPGAKPVPAVDKRAILVPAVHGTF